MWDAALVLVHYLAKAAQGSGPLLSMLDNVPGLHAFCNIIKVKLVLQAVSEACCAASE